MNIDLDRLHHCVEAINKNQPLGRQEGRTTAIVELAINKVELGGKFLVITYNQQMVKNIQRLIYDRLNEIGLISKKTGDQIAVGTSKIMIISKQKCDLLRGISMDDVLFDVDPTQLTQAQLSTITPLLRK